MEGLEIKGGRGVGGTTQSPRINKILDESPSKATTAENKSPIGTMKAGAKDAVNVVNLDEELDLE